MNNLKARLGGQQGAPPPAATHTSAAYGLAAVPPLSVIVNDELQRGHYAEGEKSLRRFVAAHPGDRSAQFMLHQLTVNPEKMLGHASRRYVVQAGDTFSTLAARYLGDPNLFLILARYNGSTNPSRLSVGQAIRLPTAAPGISTPGDTTVSGPNGTDQRAVANVPSEVPSMPAPVTEATTAKAARLQAESVALADQGHKAQALARLDQALDMDPRLQPSGAKSASLRQELLANYHQRAIILYRDQHLDQAIALWNHVLAIDPGYEPAVIYRARALEIKQRLKQF
ncbi:MAG: LysM domain-containing protein [Rhodanobacteraceae bacterium]|nr:MAG: LysM domain-containing protein [Rhodanobacteraceae bacterium]